MMIRVFVVSIVITLGLVTFLGMTEYSMAQTDVADQRVLQFADMLGDADPAVRDKIAYEGLVDLLRGEKVSDDGKRALLEKCVGQLAGPEGEGFIRPFAALCVAEVVRTDRIKSWFKNKERTDAVKTGVDYLSAVADYRGFDEQEGWRHGVAHGADLLMQLTLNDGVDRESHLDILAAIASQVSPNEHFYIYGEPARLARPAVFIAMRGTVTEDEWIEWLNQITAPGPALSDWSDAFSSQAGLSKRHNVRAFLSALYTNASMSENEHIKALIPHITSAMQKLP